MLPKPIVFVYLDEAKQEFVLVVIVHLLDLLTNRTNCLNVMNLTAILFTTSF